MVIKSFLTILGLKDELKIKFAQLYLQYTVRLHGFLDYSRTTLNCFTWLFLADDKATFLTKDREAFFSQGQIGIFLNNDKDFN